MRRTLFGALLLAWPLPLQAAVYVDDPLTSPTHPGRGSKGGSFGAQGWTTTNAPTDSSQDAVWYEIPDALESGSVQVTVTGLELGTTLAGSDHDLLVIYQAPTGQPEPVEYSPYFRNNDFKTFIRIFGTQETSRPGATKLELAFCPRGDPWWHDDACTASCDQGGIAYAFGNDNDLGWDAATPYTLRIEWSAGVMSFLRNGTFLGDVSFAGNWSPQPLRVRIGTPRNDGVYPGSVYMPAGLTFANLQVEGTPGAQTPACGAPVVDGGTPPVDAGGSSGELSVLQDVTAASWESGVFSVVDDLNVEGSASGDPAAVVYLRFPPPNGVVEKAILRVRAQAYSSAAGGSGVVCRVDDDSWQETTLTWANRPPVSSTCAGASVGVDPDTDVEWDVTPLVTGGGNVNLALVSADPDGSHFLSKEAGAAGGPTLFVTTQPGGAGTGGSGGGAGSAWQDGGTNGGSSGGGNASRGGTAEDSGCGCRAPRPPATPAFGAMLFGLLLMLARRARFR